MACDNDFGAFFKSFDLPALNIVDKVHLDLSITQLEIDNAIMKMSYGKTPGDDSLKRQLSPIHLKLF